MLRRATLPLHVMSTPNCAALLNNGVRLPVQPAYLRGVCTSADLS